MSHSTPRARLTDLILTVAVRRRCYSYPYIIDEESKAQKAEINTASKCHIQNLSPGYALGYYTKLSLATLEMARPLPFDCYQHFPNTSAISIASSSLIDHSSLPFSQLPVTSSLSASGHCYSQSTKNRILLLSPIYTHTSCALRERGMRSPLILARPRKNRQEFKLLPRYLGASWNLRLAGACKMGFVRLTLQLP